MNDLNGIDWNAKPAAPKPNNYSSILPVQKPTPPISGRSTPLVSKSPISIPTSSTTPANDSFANLVAFSVSRGNTNSSLSDQQRRLGVQHTEQLKDRKGTLGSQFPDSDDLWNSLGSGRTTPNSQAKKVDAKQEDDDDLFAAFNKQTIPVVKQSSQPISARSLVLDVEDDDDPFELSKLQTTRQTTTQVSTLARDEDDILGDLARPPTSKPLVQRPSPAVVVTENDHPQDKAVAELVEMGFSAEKARRALETTDSGLDVQAAVGWLLTQAHSEAQNKSRTKQRTDSEGAQDRNRRGLRESSQAQNLRDPAPERSTTPANEATKKAQEIGGMFLKQAGSFWKVAQKQVQQAVSEFNSDSDSSQPKWLAGSTTKPEPRRRRRSSAERQTNASTTDEAAMLEQQRPAQPPRPSRSLRPDVRLDSSADTSRDHSPVMPSRLRQTQSPQPEMPTRSRPVQLTQRTMLNKQAAEDQAAQAYTSSARRRRPPQATQLNEDILLETSMAPVRPPRAPDPVASNTPNPAPRKPPSPVRSRPPAPTRSLPAINMLSLRSSHAARIKGNDSFKLGDYTAAHEHYTTSLRHLPPQHTITLILLTNRALTSLKLGDPKSALNDSDTALTLIGPSKGDNETVDLQSGASSDIKPMRDYYGKAIQRKAEALEQLEKWTEAASTWKQCVEDGIGGQTAIQARLRAEKASAPRPAQTRPTPKPKPAARPTRPVQSTKPAAAVKALREANAAASKEDDEKFALSDNVTARVNAWRNGKEGNIRALLASLDTILWAEAGWKKVGMAELVLVNKVKINYMKGIGKTHPDKIPTSATVEQRMIAGSVFSTLNEAWDKFKSENGL